MIRAAVCRLECEPSFGRFAHEQFVAGLQLVEFWRERSIGHQFEEKLNFIFRGRRGDRIWTLDALASLFHTERGVLPGEKVEVLSRLNAKHPQVGREVSALGDSRVIKLVVRSRHRSKNLASKTDTLRA